MSHQWTVREGATQPIVFTLYDGDSLYDLSGIQSLEIRLVPKTGGSTIAFTTANAELAITDAADGEATFYPAVDTLSFSDISYHVYFWVTDANGYKISFPSADDFPLRMIQAS
jgi:hypothetical protein